MQTTQFWTVLLAEQLSFSERLARIEGNKTPRPAEMAPAAAIAAHAPKQGVSPQISAMMEGIAVEPAKTRRGSSIPGNDVWENLKYPISIALAFLLGIVAVMFSRYARFHLFASEQGASALAENVMLDGAMAMGVTFVVRMATDLKSPIHLSAMSMGVTACVLGMHFVVHQVPGLFDILFSAEWTASVLSSTEPDSLFF
ncbi:hypothetical protein IV417_04900 [Alphaproteobacteria bacterium KMM 3653]|uniref:Uncharacterized protein n=1 Tax=Harenicola maris TaxID=2841044 RepID=A0AAP2G3E3_9RHOB|nr:hypothetical protein [Harenicola maris]